MSGTMQKYVVPGLETVGGAASQFVAPGNPIGLGLMGNGIGQLTGGGMGGGPMGGPMGQPNVGNRLLQNFMPKQPNVVGGPAGGSMGGNQLQNFLPMISQLMSKGGFGGK